jgi:hypothetical protein
MNIHKLFFSIAEALMIYGLIIVGYGVLVIHVTCTWSGDWPVDRNLPWLTLDTFTMVGFALSLFGFIAWRYLKNEEKTKKHSV